MPVNLQPSTGTTGNLKKERSREGSRRMTTNSRPPLSHRIRASFEGKKSQDSTTTKHASFSGGSPTDPEVLRQAIDQAISGDAFQAGLASHIAKLLKPDIKAALDTIEPIVNAVLQHEILLKKTNVGMDHVLLSLESMADQEEAVDSTKARFSTHGALTSHPISDDPRSGELPLPISHISTPGTGTPRSFSNQKTRPLPSRSGTFTAGKLSEISDTLDSNNNKLGKLMDGITKINNLLISDERLDGLKESLEKNDTQTSVMQTQLDQLQENVRVIITRIGTDLGTNVKAINDQLAGVTTKLETAAVSHDAGGDAEVLQEISATLEVLNGNLDSGSSSNNVNLGLLKEEITTLQSTLDSQKEILLEIKEVNNNAMILAGIEKSNESHEAHIAILGELKQRNIQLMDMPNQPVLTSADTETLQTILKEVQKSNEAHEKHTAALESIKSSDTNTTILAELQKSNDSHLAHASALEGLKTSFTQPSEPTTSIDLEGLETKMDSLIETNTSILTEVQKSTESHVSHAAALENIKVLPIPPPEPIPAGESVVEIVEKNTGYIIEKLNSHAAILDDIKLNTKDATASTGVTVESFNNQFGSMSSVLETQKTLLEEIKSKDIPVIDLTPIISMLETHAVILEEIRDKEGEGSADFSPVISMLESHGAILEEIKTKGVGGRADFSPITSMLEAHGATLEEIRAKEAYIVDFSPIISTLESHTATLEEIKAKDAYVVDFSPITSTLESHGAVLHEIKSKDLQSSNSPVAVDMEAFETHFNSITGTLAAHTTALDDIKSKNGSSESALLVDTNIKALDEHFGSMASMLEAYTAALDEIKSKATRLEEPNSAAFDGHFNSLISKLESHTVVLDELKSRKNDSSPSSMPREEIPRLELFEPHITAIKSALNAHRIVLDDIKSEALAKNDMDAMVVDNILEPHIMVIKSTLNSHTAILEELKSNASTSEIGNSSLPKILESLDSHTNLLQEIKNADVSDEILTALHELQESNSTAFETLRESDVSDEILTALHTCNDSQEKLDRSLLELQTVMNTAASSEQNRKKSIEESEIQAPIAAVDLSGLETQINTVITTLESQNVVLKEIRDVTNSGMEVHSSHNATLDELRNAANASNDSHTTHAAVLGEIKDLTSMSNESHGAHSATLAVIRDATAALSSAHAAQITTLGELQEAIHKSNKSHNTHSSTLGEIKDATSSSNEAHLTHTTTLAELKVALIDSNASHASHTAVLADLKSQLSPDTAAEPMPAPILDTSGLHSQLTNIITTLESQTASLGEIKDTHNSHTTILGEIKDATTASNESHSAHRALLSEIKDATVQVHGMNEILITHTGFLQDLKEESGLRHTEISGNVEELKKIVVESSSKHEENLLKHGELIKEHGDLVRENHDGLKGTIAGLALGGIVGAGVMKAVDGEEGKLDKDDKVPEEAEEAKGITEEDMILEEEKSMLESEIPVAEELAPELTEQRLDSPVEEQVVTEIEAQLEPEIIIEEQKSINGDEDLLNLEKDAEAISTEPAVTEDNTAAHPALVEQEVELEVAVEKEEPIEEQTHIQTESPVQEVEVKRQLPAEELELATADTKDITLALDSDQAEENLPAQELVPEEIPRSIESEVPSETSPEIDISSINKEAEVEKNEEIGDTIADTIEEPHLVEDTSAVEKFEVHEQEQTPEKDGVAESSKDELEPEERHVVEEISSEEEIIAAGRSEKEVDGESKAIKEQVEDVVDGDNFPVDKIIPVAVEEDKSTEGVIPSIEDEEVHLVDEDIPAEEAKPAEILVPEVATGNPLTNPEEIDHLETKENLPEPEEIGVSSSDENSMDKKNGTNLQDLEMEASPLIPESSHGVSAEHVEISPPTGVIKPCNEEQITNEEAEKEQVVEEEPVESKIEILETHDLGSSNEEVRTERSESVTELPLEECSSESVVDPEIHVVESSDQDQNPIKNDMKVLETEDCEPSNRNASSQISENSVEPLQEECISELLVETKTSAPELKDHDQTPVESEETATEIDGSEHIKEEISSDPSETVGHLAETSISKATGETKSPVLELNNQGSVLVGNGGLPVEVNVSKLAVKELEDSEDRASLIRGEEGDLETDSQSRSNESISAEITESAVEQSEQTPDLAIENEIHVSESSDQDQVLVGNKEKSAEAEEVSESDITGCENLEQKLPLRVGERGAYEMKMKDALQDPVNGDEISSSTPETSEEVEDIVEDEEPSQSTERLAAEIPIKELDSENQFPDSNQEKNYLGTATDKLIPEPEAKDEKLIYIPELNKEIHFTTDDEGEAPSTEEQVIETYSGEPVIVKDPISEHAINEDPEDVRAREEIAVLNAQMATILDEEAEVKDNALIVEEANETIGNNVPAQTEILTGKEPKEAKGERHVEERTDLPKVQTPLQSQEIFEEQSEDELAEKGEKHVTSEQRSSESHAEDNLDDLAATSTDLEEDGSFKGPKFVASEDTILTNTDELVQDEEITPETDESTNQAQSAEDENLPEKESLEIPIGLEESTPQSLPPVEESTSEAMNDENSPLEVESVFGEEPHVLGSELVAVELPTETEPKDPQSAELGDGSGYPANIEEKRSLSDQHESENVTGEESRGTQFEPLPAMFAQDRELKDSKMKAVFKNSTVQGDVEGELSPETNLDIECENEEMADETPSVEYLEVIEAELKSEDNLGDASLPEEEESELVHEYLDDAKEPETEEKTPESTSDRIDSSKTVKDNPEENRAQELDDLAEVQSPQSSHEDTLFLNSSIHSVVSSEHKIDATNESSSRGMLTIPINEGIVEEDVPIESKTVLGHRGTIAEVKNDYSPQEDTSRDEYVSKFLPGSEPQAQPSIGNFSDAIGTPRDEVISLGKKSLPKKGKSVTEPTQDQAFKANPSFSGEPPTILKDDKQIEDITSLKPQDDEAESPMQSYRQEEEFPSYEGSLGLGAFTGDYIDTEQLGRKVEPENMEIEAAQYPTQQANFSNPESVSEQRYSGYEETPLNAQTFSDYGDENETLEPEPEPVTSGFYSRHAHSAYGSSFDKFLTEQRYPDFEETPFATHTSFNRQYNSDKSVPEVEPQTTHESASYQHENYSKTYAFQEVFGDDTKAAKAPPITSKGQGKHLDDIPPTPSPSAMTKTSTEAFPTYDESRRPLISHELNLSLPARTPQYAETIHKTPKSENKHPYLTQNEPIRTSGLSRLPVASQRSAETFRKTPELKNQLSYHRYDELPTSKSPQGLTTSGLPTRKQSSVEKSRGNSEFGSQVRVPKRDEGHSGEFKFGLEIRDEAVVESKGEMEGSVDRGNIVNTRSLLRRFEGEE
ncbi:hypothetical protein SS1G_03021 [Sclerotinia sclerotiorum 1980 UF-70]|uniref:Uncharacterized protein n=1 Tax=Sclerotinia sclerotiorum (strain ATCC 18683 / 1980 / Ss-1) TaxID=665079 RepID=A7ECI2_SCLS1|nr:hypothetical protein SS1G_03021 [Sclerotinia sclerotiorum 1980 UF-70]EDO00161.1 hypothetical protein SS1G_03021 [Sclerotinia sclerotiorum 1980 UF-70]